MSKYDRPKGTVLKYNKLIRDRIPELIEQSNRKAITHVADDDEYWGKLKEKLEEEVDEFIETDKEKELADILEIIYTICDFKKIDKKDLEKLRKQRSEERGPFKLKLILDKVQY